MTTFDRRSLMAATAATVTATSVGTPQSGLQTRRAEQVGRVPSIRPQGTLFGSYPWRILAARE